MSIQTQDVPDALLDMTQLCSYLGVTRDSVYYMRSQGRGPQAIRFGRSLRFRKSAVDEWLSSHEES